MTPVGKNGINLLSRPMSLSITDHVYSFVYLEPFQLVIWFAFSWPVYRHFVIFKRTRKNYCQWTVVTLVAIWNVCRSRENNGENISWAIILWALWPLVELFAKYNIYTADSGQIWLIKEFSWVLELVENNITTILTRNLNVLCMIRLSV